MKLILVICLILTTAVQGQIDKKSELFITLKQKDSVFFERGFNLCDIDFLLENIAQDLKFFHDQSGIQNKDQFIENTEKYICSNPEKKPIRKPKDGSFKVFPLYNNGKLYGAIQNGIHHFYIREKSKEDVWTNIAKFTHVWVLEDGSWKLSQVLSYDHQNPPASDKN